MAAQSRGTSALAAIANEATQAGMAPQAYPAHNVSGTQQISGRNRNRSKATPPPITWARGMVEIIPSGMITSVASTQIGSRRLDDPAQLLCIEIGWYSGGSFDRNGGSPFIGVPDFDAAAAGECASPF